MISQERRTYRFHEFVADSLAWIVSWPLLVRAARRRRVSAAADLAVLLARHLDRPREAKKLLAALFAAPGTVKLTSRSLTVKLMPAGSAAEQAAYARFLDDVTRLNLSLPGDPDGLALRWMLT
jgi:hypothetical protein